jgi:hypothetical protein
MKKYVILISIYNDWKSVFKLLKNIDLQTASWSAEVSVLLVNDFSTEDRPKATTQFQKIKSLRVINMKNNQGHARCNATGLKFLIEKEDFDYVILMDGDGEDRPEELTLLFNRSAEYPLKTITADRIKRSEGLFFRFLYNSHKILTYIFTGKLIRFGNYSCVPKKDVIKLISTPSLWSSFSGSISKAISNKDSIPSIRGKRYYGPSKMNLYNLILHSFSIIAVFRMTALIRSLLFVIFYLFFVSSNLSIITFLPVLIIIIFLYFIFKVSSRESSSELEKSLDSIDDIDILQSSNSRQKMKT